MKTITKLPAVTLPKKSRDIYGNTTTYAQYLIDQGREAVKEWTSWEDVRDLLDRLETTTGQALRGEVLAIDLEAAPETYSDGYEGGKGVLIVIDLLVQRYDHGTTSIIDFHGYARTTGETSDQYLLTTYVRED